MKISALFPALLTVLLITILFAPHACTQQVISSPEVHPNQTVTFRLNAPTASYVLVDPLGQRNGLGRGPYEMNKGQDGIWAVTTPPVRAGFHYYHLLVDGVKMLDPTGSIYFGHQGFINGLEVPEKGVDFYEAKDVSHGDVRTRWYHSNVTGKLRRAIVYTPPDYDLNGAARHYPVLYLQHGLNESELAWSMQGRVNFILDNLIATGAAKPIIVVMDNGQDGDPQSEAACVNLYCREGDFEKIILNELVPLIDRQYRTLPDRKHRALAGLSMGAGQALTIGLRHLDSFATVAAFSPGAVARHFDLARSYGGIFQQPNEVNEKLNLLFLSCGKLDGGYEAARAMHQSLEAAKVHHVWFESQESHEWQAWRKALYTLAPLLFAEN